LGEQLPYDCPACEHEADATYRRIRYRARWFVGNSFSTACPGGSKCLALHVAWLAEAGIETSAEELLSDPRPALSAAGSRRQQQPDAAPPLPTRGQIDGWHSRLLEQRNSGALDYLLGRGIALEIIRRYRIGWDGRCLTFPMRGRFLKRREPHSWAQMKCWPGKDRPWPLYPRVPREHGWVLLVAGELDALCGLSSALPAASVTLGAGYWRRAWTRALRGLPVVVCFDNDEHELALAERRVRELRAAGIRARHVDLRTLGLTTEKGDLSDYLNAGGDPGRLKPPRGRTAG
jgi:hypothetical protein